MNAVLSAGQKETSLRWKKMLSALVLGVAMLVPAVGGQAFAQSATAPTLSAWGDRDRRDNDRRDNDRDRHDRDRRDNDRRHDRYDHRDNDRGRYDRDRRHDGRYDNRRHDRWDRNDRNRYDYRPGYGYGYGNGYYNGSYTSLRGVVLDVNERSGYARVRADNGRVYTVRANRRELDNLRRGERVSVRGRFQGGTIYADDINER